MHRDSQSGSIFVAVNASRREYDWDGNQRGLATKHQSPLRHNRSTLKSSGISKMLWISGITTIINRHIPSPWIINVTPQRRCPPSRTERLLNVARQKSDFQSFIHYSLIPSGSPSHLGNQLYQLPGTQAAEKFHLRIAILMVAADTLFIQMIKSDRD